MLSKCQKEKMESEGRMNDGAVGVFVPTCEENGDYSALQSWASTGEAWCSTQAGTLIPGTTMRGGTPDCALG